MSSITKQKKPGFFIKKKERQKKNKQRNKRKKAELLALWSFQEVAKILKPAWSFVVSPEPSWTPD